MLDEYNIMETCYPSSTAGELARREHASAYTNNTGTEKNAEKPIKILEYILRQKLTKNIRVSLGFPVIRCLI